YWCFSKFRYFSTLSFSWVLHLNFSLNIRATGSYVPHRSLDQSYATPLCRCRPDSKDVSPGLILAYR
ncbi:hypothetical protein ACFL1Z_09110, partial [Thermodesulfobacteriota bacterium]